MKLKCTTACRISCREDLVDGNNQCCQVSLRLNSLFHAKFLSFNPSAQVEVGHVREIDEIFDAISYKKGAAIIRMLQTYLGADTFQVCNVCRVS